MTQFDAEKLAAAIRRMSGWHAVPYRDTWSDAWSVRAWPDEYVDDNAPDDPWGWYSLRNAGDWYRLRRGLAKEAALEATPTPVSVVDDQPF